MLSDPASEGAICEGAREGASPEACCKASMEERRAFDNEAAGERAAHGDASPEDAINPGDETADSVTSPTPVVIPVDARLMSTGDAFLPFALPPISCELTRR